MSETINGKSGIEKAREMAAKIKADTQAAAIAKATAKATNETLNPTTPKVTTGRSFGKFTIRKAERSMSRLRVGLAGPSGSGKTYSALLLAHGLAAWEDIAIIDTENGSADLYSHLGPYNVLTLEKPFSPDRYIEAIQAAQDAGVKVIIIDSITHEWSGQGGILEMQDKLGGSFRDWAKVTPIHNRFVQAILQSKTHIITTVRSKTDYSMSNEGGGKSKVQKVGLKPETREGFEYEMTVAFDLNINNMATVSKDRTGIYPRDAAFIITEDNGRQLAEWADGGIDYVTKIEDLLRQKNKTVDPILSHFKVFGLDELSPAQFKAAITKLESLPDAVAAPQAPAAAPEPSLTKPSPVTAPTPNGEKKSATPESNTQAEKTQSKEKTPEASQENLI